MVGHYTRLGMVILLHAYLTYIHTYIIGKPNLIAVCSVLYFTHLTVHLYGRVENVALVEYYIIP